MSSINGVGSLGSSFRADATSMQSERRSRIVDDGDGGEKDREARLERRVSNWEDRVSRKEDLVLRDTVRLNHAEHSLERHQNHSEKFGEGQIAKDERRILNTQDSIERHSNRVEGAERRLARAVRVLERYRENQGE